MIEEQIVEMGKQARYCQHAGSGRADYGTIPLAEFVETFRFVVLPV
jgi:hypothetical protein